MLLKTFVLKLVTYAYGLRLAVRNLLRVMFFLTLSTVPLAAQDPITIVAFGDSLTQGYGLPQSDGLVPQLQGWLHANGAKNVTVLNAGVSGDTTAGGLARIAWTLDDTVDGVIVTLGGNDLLRGVFPDASKANLDGILQVVTDAGLPALLVGLPGPSNYGPEFKAEFDAMYPALATKHDVLLYPFYFEGLGAGEDTAAMLEFMQDDGTHPNAIGVGKIVVHIGPSVLELIAQIEP